MLRLMTINIGAASRQRAERLLRWLADRPDDAFLLTETSAGPGTTYLLDQFRRAGYAVVHSRDPGDRGAALVSRIPLLDEPLPLDNVTIPGRVAAAVLDTQPQVCLLGVYVPNRDRGTLMRTGPTPVCTVLPFPRPLRELPELLPDGSCSP